MEIHLGGGRDVSKRSEITARDLVLEVLQELPHATREQRFERFRGKLAEFSEFQRSVDWYFYANNETYLLGTRQSKRENPRERERARRALVEAAKSKILLLSLPMPNGKLMRECVGVEMAAFGASYKRIADRVGKLRVGDVLSEDEVRKLMVMR